MDRTEFLTAVNDAHPELMSKTAQMVAALEKISPEFVPDVTADFNTIFSVLDEKTAAISPDTMGGLQRFGLGVAGTVAGGLLGAVATDLYDAAKRGLTKGRNFNRIMEANPNLKREVDPKSLRMAYNTLHRYAPDFTADPLVGGALLKQVSELPQMSHKTIVELIGARKDINDAKGRHFSDMSRLSPLLQPDRHVEIKEETGKGTYRSMKRPARPGE